MKTELNLLTGMLKVHLPSMLILVLWSLSSSAQWTTNVNNIYNTNTGNVGIGTTAPASKFQVIGESRFGDATNYFKVSTTGSLSFNGSALYQVISNKYAFKHSNAGNRGLYVNKTNSRFEFRDSTANDLFHVDYYNGNSFIKGSLGIGTSTVPSESGLVVEGFNSTTEGGQIQLNCPKNGGTTNTKAYFIDNFQETFRIMDGTNAGSQNIRVLIKSSGHFHINTTTTGPNGAYFTVKDSSSNAVGAYNATGWVHSSDERLKTNIEPLENALDKIIRLQGVSYNWKTLPNSNNQIGFIAQEVEKVFPEVIAKDDGGNYSMAIQNLVAPIVEAIKEQQTKIKEKDGSIKHLQSSVNNLQNENALLKSRLEISENALAQCCTGFNPVSGSSETIIEDMARLEQNNPNPFNEKTIIRYYIPQSVSAASLKIYSLIGEEIKSVPVNSKGVNELEIAANTLSAGTYNYLLIVDGKTIDTKQMILTK